jgi:hypothetical protein
MEEQPRERITVGQEWLGFLLSPAAWGIYFVLLYVLDEAACKLDFLTPGIVLPLATVFGIITLGMIGFAARRAYRSAQGEEEGESGRFLGSVGLMLCGLFSLSTIAVWVSVLVLMPC